MNDSVLAFVRSSSAKSILKAVIGALKVMVSALPEAPNAEPIVRKSPFINLYWKPVGL